ncbi:hypothetical protein N183_30530 [Sinorhizobium sp. Sb3]|nr:hypothetical protein N183_30530 [Sinorhizobium sp. Sb3]
MLLAKRAIKAIDRNRILPPKGTNEVSHQAAVALWGGFVAPQKLDQRLEADTSVDASA